jgi:hypothetical protein
MPGAPPKGPSGLFLVRARRGASELGLQIHCQGGDNAPASSLQVPGSIRRCEVAPCLTLYFPRPRAQELTASRCWSSSSKSTIFQSLVSACNPKSLRPPAPKALGARFFAPNNLGNKRGGISCSSRHGLHIKEYPPSSAALAAGKARCSSAAAEPVASHVGWSAGQLPQPSRRASEEVEGC